MSAVPEWPCMSTRPPASLLFLLIPLLLLLPPSANALDVFCGNLSVFEQQRFARHSVILSSQETGNLKQCLELCCSVLNCEGVSFLGVIESRGEEPNCQLVSCPTAPCELSAREAHSSGILSVQLRRHASPSPPPSETSGRGSPRPPPSPAAPFLRSEAAAPVWAVALAIIVAVVCVVVNAALLSAYICYRRQRSRQRSAQITAAKKMPTLHAFTSAF